MSLHHPWMLLLLPLALLPLIARRSAALANSGLFLLPQDRASAALDLGLRLLGTLALTALILGVAEPYRPEYEIERVGQGAEIVLVLDRSHSMDQGFVGPRANGTAPRGTGPEAIDYYTSLAPGRLRESKGTVARRVLSDFTARRTQDRFGMVVFSTLPIRVLDFTAKRAAIRAAITAGDIGRGLSETNIGLAMQSALSFFDDLPYTGSRIVMLLSDGGDRLDTDVKDRITHLARKNRVAIYWLYLRSANSPGLELASGEPSERIDTVPEYALNAFFESTGAPYHAFEAGTPAALQKALDQVDEQQNLPISYHDTVPRRELASPLLGAALVCVVLLLAANFLERRRWA